MALPLPEDREATRQALAADDLFCSNQSKEQLARLELMGKKAVNDEVVFISDLHVDQPTVLTKLKTLMKGMSELSKSPIFVFMGNFTSIPMGHGTGGIERMKSGFTDLADIINVCLFQHQLVFQIPVHEMPCGILTLFHSCPISPKQMVTICFLD